MADQIIYPSIDLFLYDLSDGLGQTEEEIQQNYRRFCQKIYGDLDEKDLELKCDRMRERSSSQEDAVELLEAHPHVKRMDPSIDGWYYPVRIGDTLALQVNYAADGSSKPQEMTNHPFLKLKQDVVRLTFQQNSILGQTWLLWGKLTVDKQDHEVEHFAQECYLQFVKNFNCEIDWKRDCIGKGKWLGGDVFEVLHCSSSKASEDIHLLIWLFPYTLSLDEVKHRVPEAYHDLTRLLQYRHKIIYSFRQSRLLKQRLKKKYAEARQLIQFFSQPPNQHLMLNQLHDDLRDSLSNWFEYSLELTALTHHHKTVQVNLDNYKCRLKSMKQKYPDHDLDFFATFNDAEVYAKKYDKQLELDCANLSLGLTLLESLSSTIQSVVELEKTKSERDLNTTVAIASIGLGFSGITATVISVQVPQPRSILDVSFIGSPAFIWSFVVASPFCVIFIWSKFRAWFKRVANRKSMRF